MVAVERLQVPVRAESLLEYPGGRMALFCDLPGEARPVWVPLLRVVRRTQVPPPPVPGLIAIRSDLMRRSPLDLPQAWMRLRFLEPEDRLPFLAEYDLVRTDGHILIAEEVRRDPLAIHVRRATALNLGTSRLLTDLRICYSPFLLLTRIGAERAGRRQAAAERR